MYLVIEVTDGLTSKECDDFAKKFKAKPICQLFRGKLGSTEHLPHLYTYIYNILIIIIIII